MTLRSRGLARRVSSLCALVVLALPLAAAAQDRAALDLVPQALSLEPAPAAPVAPRAAAREWSADRGVFVPLYTGFAVLQGLDVHSTRLALRNGAVEANPLMSGVAGNTAALIAVKAGSAAGVIFLTEKVRHRSRAGAIVLMAAVNSAYAAVVAHNYRVGSR